MSARSKRPAKRIIARRIPKSKLLPRAELQRRIARRSIWAVVDRVDGTTRGLYNTRGLARLLQRHFRRLKQPTLVLRLDARVQGARA